MAEQKGKGREADRHQPSLPHTQHWNHPGPSHLAQAKRIEDQPPDIVGEEQSGETAPKQAVDKDELIYWRHIGKAFGMRVYPWLNPSTLAYACRCKSQEVSEVQEVVEFLQNSGIEPELWTMGIFQSQVCFYYL